MTGAAPGARGAEGIGIDASTPEDARLTLLQLQALHAVANQGSFVLAATMLGCTQSAVSQRIAAIERRLGVLLVRRVAGQREVRLTDAGATLVAAAEQIQVILRTAIRHVDAIRHGLDTTVRIGLFSSTCIRVIPPVVAAIQRESLQCRIELVEIEDDGQLQELLRHGEIDIAFVIFPLANGHAHGFELFADPFVLLTPRDSALAGLGRSPGPADLRDLPLVALSSEKDEIAAELRRRGVEPNWVFATENNYAVEALVAQRVGHAIVPRLALGERHPNVLRLPAGDIMPARVIGVALSPHHPRLSLLRRVIDVMRAVCADGSGILPPIDQPLPAPVCRPTAAQ